MSRCSEADYKWSKTSAFSCRTSQCCLQVTAILYANPDWEPCHGGQLRIWLPPLHHAEHIRHTCLARHDDCEAQQLCSAGCQSVTLGMHASSGDQHAVEVMQQLSADCDAQKVQLRCAIGSSLHHELPQNGLHYSIVKEEPVVDLDPVSGRVVVFLSGAIDHAVLPSHRPRVALTAWCR